MYSSKKRIKELVKMCDTGLSMRSLAMSIDIHEGYMRQIKLGIHKPSDKTLKLIRKEVSRRVKWLRKAKPEQRILRHIQVETDASMAHIARLMGCTRQAVNNYLKRNTVPQEKLEEITQIYFRLADCWEREVKALDKSTVH